MAEESFIALVKSQFGRNGRRICWECHATPVSVEAVSCPSCGEPLPPMLTADVPVVPILCRKCEAVVVQLRAGREGHGAGDEWLADGHPRDPRWPFPTCPSCGDESFGINPTTRRTMGQDDFALMFSTNNQLPN